MDKVIILEEDLEIGTEGCVGWGGGGEAADVRVILLLFLRRGTAVIEAKYCSAFLLLGENEKNKDKFKRKKQNTEQQQ